MTNTRFLIALLTAFVITFFVTTAWKSGQPEAVDGLPMGMQLRETPNGLEVASVKARATAFGLQAGDIIQSIDQSRVVDYSSFEAAIHGKSPNDKLSVAVRRGESLLTINRRFEGAIAPLPNAQALLGRGPLSSDAQVRVIDAIPDHLVEDVDRPDTQSLDSVASVVDQDDAALDFGDDEPLFPAEELTDAVSDAMSGDDFDAEDQPSEDLFLSNDDSLIEDDADSFVTSEADADDWSSDDGSAQDADSLLTSDEPDVDFGAEDADGSAYEADDYDGQFEATDSLLTQDNDDSDVDAPSQIAEDEDTYEDDLLTDREDDVASPSDDTSSDGSRVIENPWSRQRGNSDSQRDAVEDDFADERTNDDAEPIETPNNATREQSEPAQDRSVIDNRQTPLAGEQEYDQNYPQQQYPPATDPFGGNYREGVGATGNRFNPSHDNYPNDNFTSEGGVDGYPADGFAGNGFAGNGFAGDNFVGDNFVGDGGQGYPGSMPGEPAWTDLIYYGGWLSTGYHSESNNLFNNRPDEINLHQGWLLLGKDTTSTSRFGGRVDLLYGIDGLDAQAFGNNPGVWDFQNGFDHGSYSWAMPQAYGQVGGDTWDVKVGRFVTILGFESIAATSNFFYSHSMSFFLSEPRTHTGVLARKQLTERWEVYAGWTLGWDTGFDQFGSGSAWLGGSRYWITPSIRWSSATTAGDFGYRGYDGVAQTYLLEVHLLKNLHSATQADLFRVDSTGEDSVSVAQYLFYNASNAVRIGSRLEWWKGDSTTGYAPHGGVIPMASGNLSYYAATFGANFCASNWLTVRPEVRYDWSPAVNYDQAYFGIDAILQF